MRGHGGDVLSSCMNSVRVSFCTSFFFGAAVQTQPVSKRHPELFSSRFVPMIVVLVASWPRATTVEARSQV